jgi:sugar phosphate isomerase/epimerase
VIPARRVAAAPISWGVCEVPGWGHQLSAGRVLAEMRELGVAATEFGPDGFLPADPGERARLLGSHGLRPVGGFVPLVLHDPGRDPLPEASRALDSFGEAGERISHVHLKDVDAALAEAVQTGRTSYTQAVKDGIYRPLGRGGIDVRGIVGALEGAGYGGWYVLEQDTVLTGEPAPGTGPKEDVRACLDFLAPREGEDA